MSEQLPFLVLEEALRSFPKFNATGCSLIITFRASSEEQDPTTYLKACKRAIKDYLVDNVPGRDLVGLRIRST